MFLVVVLVVSALSAFSDAAAKNSLTFDADLGSILGVTATGNIGWGFTLGAGGGYDLVIEGGTFFANANYPVELTKTTFFDKGTLYGTLGGGYRFADGDANDSEHIGEAILGLFHKADNRWDVGAKTHLGGGDEGFEWAAYLTVGYRFEI